MASMCVIRRKALALFAAVCMVAATGAPAWAQESEPPPNTGNVSVSAGVDALNAYMFRGIFQDDGHIITWPYVELGLGLFEGDGGLKSVSAAVGIWNSLHPGDSSPGDGRMWYESDFYATLGLGFGGGVSLDTTYTAYNSPNGAFDTVEEIGFLVGVDDSARLGRASLQPYALVAFEFDGQADGGLNEGTYLELGVSPGYEGAWASVSVPLKVGVSLSDYYELEVSDGVFEDNRFGYFSIAGVVTVPIRGIPARFGAWDVHGGVELQRLGTTTKAFNDGDASKVIGLFGVSLSY